MECVTSEWSLVRFYTGNVGEFKNHSAIFTESQQYIFNVFYGLINSIDKNNNMRSIFSMRLPQNRCYHV